MNNMRFLTILATAVFMTGCHKEAASSASSTNDPGAKAADLSSLKSDDGQPLILIDTEQKAIPPRPTNPDALPETDPGHWWDKEYAGWNPSTTRAEMPPAPSGGARGKKVVFLRFIDHPYLNAMVRGMKKVAEAEGIDLTVKTADNDNQIQASQVQEAINSRPDLVILSPVDETAAVKMLRDLNKAGIPVISCNKLVVDEGMRYALAWCGPDDWGQFRMLAGEFAKAMKSEGGYCVVQHFPGGSPFFARTYGATTELAKIAPKMKLLDAQSTNLDATKTMQVVSDWLVKYGKELKGIISADDGQAMNGILEALKKAGRRDVVVVAAGNSKIGMDAVKAGTCHAITYQSAEADGAVPMKLAADWLNGVKLDQPVYYLPKKLITKGNVEEYMPAQW
jgi:ABC-type sugar transport system substrate-binding protein